jgi:hypothetical protein
MGETTKAKCTDKTAHTWAKKIMKAFQHAGSSCMQQFKSTFELGGDVTPKEGEQKPHVAGVLSDDDTFMVIQKAIDGLTKKS